MRTKLAVGLLLLSLCVCGCEKRISESRLRADPAGQAAVVQTSQATFSAASISGGAKSGPRS